VRVVFAGTPAPAVPSLRALLASRHEVVAVLTRPDAGAGRGRRQAPSPVAEVALEAGVEVLRPERPAHVLDRLVELAPDCCPVVAYGHLLRREVLDVPRLGWVNLHFSLLPAWRGAAPVQRALMAGDEITGATTFVLDEGMDTGPVLGTLTEAVRPRDTSGDLLGRLGEAGAQLLVASLDALEDGTVTAVPQPAEGVSLAPKVEVDDARVVWTAPALAVDRHVRACTPAPGAWTTWRDQRAKVGPVEPATDGPEGDLAPGELLVGRREVLVGTGSGPVRLGTVQPAGKKALAAADWARGVRPEPGERFA
jgi:methionyl-tRNA formyltransferase